MDTPSPPRIRRAPLKYTPTQSFHRPIVPTVAVSEPGSGLAPVGLPLVAPSDLFCDLEQVCTIIFMNIYH